MYAHLAQPAPPAVRRARCFAIASHPAGPRSRTAQSAGSSTIRSTGQLRTSRPQVPLASVPAHLAPAPLVFVSVPTHPAPPRAPRSALPESRGAAAKSARYSTRRDDVRTDGGTSPESRVPRNAPTSQVGARSPLPARNSPPALVLGRLPKTASAAIESARYS
ncbi:hypothetical protein B0H15DRAFT_478609 [Mycena belliarum]|uniref:Uncharacterized protein n=1 Tax=Mycena belliarum TaxID=1033014 RepID=A0AAD6U0M6_9AGAR|nr:hypothetical protein B0H15DRAFT_478609 [Mycena belliae]